MNVLLALLLLLSSDVGVGEEVYYYDILIKGKKVGELEARREVNGHRVSYINKSLTKARLLKSMEVMLLQEAVYEQGILQSARSTTLVNDHVHSLTEISKRGDQYLILADGTELRKPAPIRYSAVKLMLEEPKEFDRSFSEHQAEFHRLVRIGENTYRKLSPDGKENLYHYRNGKLYSAQIDAGFYSFEMKLQKRD